MANPTIPVPIFQEEDTTPAAVESRTAAPQGLSPIVQTQVAQVLVLAAQVPVPAAVLPAVGLHLLDHSPEEVTNSVVQSWFDDEVFRPMHNT